MRDKIKDLIQKYPKHYVSMIKRDKEMLDWVNVNCLTTEDHFPTKIYSAINSDSMVCPNGNARKVVRWNSPLSYCGHASTCLCNKTESAKKTSDTKLAYSFELNEAINSKREDTLLKKYGYKFNSQRPEIKPILQKSKISKDSFNKLNDKNWLNEEYQIKNRSQVDIADELGVYYSTVGTFCVKHGFPIRRRSNYSLTELKIAEFIRSMGFIVEHGDWSVLGDKELDLLLPEKNIAIEINGLYWHSFNPSSGKTENPERHLEKTVRCKEKNIELIHITDWEWENKQEIIKSILAVKLGKVTTRIFARSCKAEYIDSKTAKVFLDQHHLQGFTVSSDYIGLYYKNDLVMVMSFGRNRFKTGSITELHRLCTKLNTVVVGGASKLIKQYRKKDKLPIESYCDISKSSGKGYVNIGFALLRETGPGYIWTCGNSVISRYKAQKAQLKKWLPSFDPAKSESTNMFSAGYRRMYDCGNYVFRMD